MNTNDIQRRSILGAGMLAMASATTAQIHDEKKMPKKTFVLVHGAWHGGWCWGKVSDLLLSKGHKVYAPSLTGNGDRSHLLSKDINLDTHIADIVNLFKWENLRDVCLVAHSYGGWPVAGALEEISPWVSSLVLLDAFKPENGQKGIDYASEFSRKSLADAISRGEAGRKPPEAKSFSMFEKDLAWLQEKMTPQPNGVATQPIRLTGARERVAKKTYIRAPHYPQPSFDQALAQCKSDPTWKTFVMNDTGHDVMVDQPERLVDLLLQVA